MGLVVTVEGSWEISDSLLVIWCNMKCDVFWDKRDVILHVTSKKNLELAYFCEKWSLSEKCNN